MRRYVSTQLERRREATAQRQVVSAGAVPLNLKRDLAEKIVKLIRQNPAFASDAEYDRIVGLISEYTVAIGITAPPLP